MIDRRVTSLLAVAEEQNFTKAAERLSLTQPAISQHIRQLEEELGVPLFIRGKGAIRPTDAGKTVIRYARRFNTLFDRMKTELADRDKQMTRLRVGVTHTAESNIVAEVLAEYGNLNPGVVITILTDTIKNLYARLDDYDLDMAIVEGVPTIPTFDFILLDTDYLVCAMSNENQLAKKPMVTLNDLLDERMILRRAGSATMNLFMASLESLNRSIDEFHVILEVDNIATIKDLVRKNLGISILPKSTCMDEVSKGKMTVLPIENMSMIRETKIVYSKDFSHPHILSDLTELYANISRRRNRNFEG